METEAIKEENSEYSNPDTKQKSSGLELLTQVFRLYGEVTELTTNLKAAIEKISKLSVTDALTPAAVAEKTETVGVNKTKLNLLSTVMLGILAGVFIGLGAMFYTVVTTDAELGFGMTKLIGGLVFCLGLVLVVVAGAELFTGNSLMVISWISGRTTLAYLFRNWGLVYFANLLGALSLAGLMFYTNQWTFDGYGVGANALLIANAKVNLSFGSALVRGILCNVLVCLAVWLCFSARTVTDKILAILFPITAFVAAGFEHSIANMYFIPMGMILAGKSAVLNAAGVTANGIANLTWAGFFGNLVPVTIGNVIGGGIFIGIAYWVVYLRSERAAELISVRPWIRKVVPHSVFIKLEESVRIPQLESVRVQIEELIRTKMNEPAMLDSGGRALLTVLAKARDDSDFLAKLSDNSTEALKDYDLTSEEKAAILSGDIRWIESKLGTLDEPLKTWLTARLAQEKW